MDDKTTEHEAITQPIEESLSEQTMVSNATMPLQLPESPPPPPPIPENYVPPGGDSSWKWILGSAFVVILVLIAGAIGFTAGHGEGCPCDPTRDARNHAFTIEVIEGTAQAVVIDADSRVLTLDADYVISSENELIVRDTLVAVEGTSSALSTAVFVNATSRATQQAIATANFMTIQAAETTIANQSIQITALSETNAALDGSRSETPDSSDSPAESSETEPEPAISSSNTVGTPPPNNAGNGSFRVIPPPPDSNYPFSPVTGVPMFRDAWLHEGCNWQGMGGHISFLENTRAEGLQIHVQAPEIGTIIITAGTADAYGDDGWEAFVSGVPENRIVYQVQLYDSNGVSPLSPAVEVRFNGQCETNLLQLDFIQIERLGVG